MVLLIDTNIVLDVLLNRSEFVKDSSVVWKLCETEQAKGYLSTLILCQYDVCHEKAADTRSD